VLTRLDFYLFKYGILKKGTHGELTCLNWHDWTAQFIINKFHSNSRFEKKTHSWNS